MFQYILVPTDLTDRATRTIDVLKGLVGDKRVKVILLHVVEQIPETNPEEFREFYAGLEERSAAKLASLAARLNVPTIDESRHVIYGHPAVEITRFAETQQADLITLSSRASLGGSDWVYRPERYRRRGGRRPRVARLDRSRSADLHRRHSDSRRAYDPGTRSSADANPWIRPVARHRTRSRCHSPRWPTRVGSRHPVDVRRYGPCAAAGPRPHEHDPRRHRLSSRVAPLDRCLPTGSRDRRGRARDAPHYALLRRLTCPPATSPDPALGSWVAGGGRMLTTRYRTEEILSQPRWSCAAVGGADQRVGDRVWAVWLSADHGAGCGWRMARASVVGPNSAITCGPMTSWRSAA